MICSSCSEGIRESAKFCNACGTQVELPVIEKVQQRTYVGVGSQERLLQSFRKLQDYAQIETESPRKFFIWAGVFVALALLLIAVLSSGSERSGDAPDPYQPQQVSTGHYETRCSTVFLPRSDMTAMEALKRGLSTTIPVRECKQVWVED